MCDALIERAAHRGERVAIASGSGELTYARLLDASRRAAVLLLGGSQDLRESRVAFMVHPGRDHVAVQWGIWRAGGIAVPLAPSHPLRELEYVIDDARPDVVVADGAFEESLRPEVERRGLRWISTAACAMGRPGPAGLPRVDQGRGATILYTSGSTGRPKGVLATHANLRAQMESLVSAWEWTDDDRVLLVLPLHHVHGMVNVLGCSLWSGATCEIQPRFDAGQVWERLASGELTLFMAVPTIYAKLAAAWEAAEDRERRRWSSGCGSLRLMVSGSAALPERLCHRWREITGHVLLERYGMTEIGMALSNPLRGQRRPGHVGKPLPGVEVRLTDETGRPVADGQPGEISVRGDTVFREYWDRPEATREAFLDDWFRTGDVAVCENGSHRILGRMSVDIIKSGGYKISALEIEDVLRQHPEIADCAVVGVADDEWGERVGVALVAADGCRGLSLDALRDWARDRLASYKLPTLLLQLPELPANAMGKPLKPRIAKLFDGARE